MPIGSDIKYGRKNHGQMISGFSKYIGLVVQNIMSARFPFHIDFRDTGKDLFQKIRTANQNPDSVNYVYNRGTSIVPLVYKRRWVGGSKMSTFLRLKLST